MGLRARLQLLLVCSALDCGGSAPPAASHRDAPTVTASACPPDAFIEALHAAAYHFENDAPSVAREDLRRADGWSPAPADDVSRALLVRLSEVSRRVDTDPMWARTETEEIRAAFAEWPCLGDVAHARYHDALGRDQ